METSRWETTRSAKVSVGTSSTKLLDANPNRIGFVITNTSDLATKIITINLGASAAVSKEGVVLGQNAAYSESTNAGFECFGGEITAISEVAGGQISIMERLKKWA